MRKLKWWHVILLLALLACFLSPLASSSPDGLERVAEDQGFIDKVTEPPLQLMADYLFPGIHNEALATILSGIIGTLVVFGLVYGVSRLLSSRHSSSSSQ